jgi:pteridine reductase
LKNYPLYSVAKAGLIMVTKALAKELAPDVRVNGVAPGAILWAEQQEDDSVQRQVLAQIALQRCGSPDDIAQAAIYLITAGYVTGQILQIDGGRTLNQ